MNVIVKRKNAASPAPSQKRDPAPCQRFGIWGRVEAAHSEDNTVDLTLENGIPLMRVPVASREWVVPGEDAGKGHNSGERDLPPVHARVFVMMPTFTYYDCFVAPFSGFSTIDQTAPYMEDEKEKTKERITPSGWHITENGVTGSRKSVSPDGKTSLEIDYGSEEEPKEENPELHLNIFDNIRADITGGENIMLSFFDEVKMEHVKGETCTVKIFDTELVIKKGEVSVKPKKTAIEVDGDAVFRTAGKTTVEATGDATVKGANVKVEATGNAALKGTNVTVDASSLLTLKTGDAGTFMPNTVPQCPFGIPHGGKAAGITKLCGA
jgi:hypothetical protein